MDEEAKKTRREYMKAWREANRDHIREYKKEWNKENREKVHVHMEKYWEKKARERKEPEK